MDATFRQIQVDSARIIHENVDNETLIIDAETGVYYVLRGSGAEIWELIRQGTDSAGLINQMAQRYTTPVDELQPLLQNFLNQLQAAELTSCPGRRLVCIPFRIVKFARQARVLARARTG